MKTVENRDSKKKDGKKKDSKRKDGRLIILVLVLLVLFTGVTRFAGSQMHEQRHPNFTTFSNRTYGISLLYDTLQYMGYPVGVLYRPVNESLSTGGVVFIVQPTNPRPTPETADSILEWVQMGGRLVYLENRQPTVIDRALSGHDYAEFGSMRWYRHGMGEIITGRASALANTNLMANASYGAGIAYVLAGWNPDFIYFAEYYHGFHSAGGLFSQMPIWLQLVTVQIGIIAIILIWHLGKRFGKPVPLYEEIEREENEQIMVLARLYRQAK